MSNTAWLVCIGAVINSFLALKHPSMFISDYRCRIKRPRFRSLPKTTLSENVAKCNGVIGDSLSAKMTSFVKKKIIIEVIKKIIIIIHNDNQIHDSIYGCTVSG